MKKLKKLVVAVLSMAMMMSMSMVSFAANTAEITIKNVDANVTMTYAQVIAPDSTARTGWKLVDATAADFMSAFDKTDAQEAIEAYMDANESTRAAAIAKIATSETFTNPLTVDVAGLYVINITDNDGKYSYKTMAAYVGMTVDGNTTTLENAELNAKKEPTKVDKTIAPEDVYADTVQDVVYTVKTTVPYVPDNTVVESIKFAVNDSLTGGEYVVDANGMLSCQVEGEASPRLVKVENNAFTLDLSDLVTVGNEKANQEVVIKYAARVTEQHAQNKAFPTICDHKYDDEDHWITVDSFSGPLTIKKTSDDGKLLAGAEFVVRSQYTKKFAQFEEKDGKLWLSAWVDKQEDASKILTGEDGLATVNGFDKDFIYEFIETNAPEGYSINNEPAIATWTGEGEAVAATAVMKDTKLSALPFTGGIGTTIFTVLGVAIMVVAAGLLFATRKKNAK